MRLRRASRGEVCTELLEVERRSGPCATIKDPVRNVRNARLADYRPLYTDEEAALAAEPKVEGQIREVSNESDSDDGEKDVEEEVSDYIR